MAVCDSQGKNAPDVGSGARLRRGILERNGDTGLAGADEAKGEGGTRGAGGVYDV